MAQLDALAGELGVKPLGGAVNSVSRTSCIAQ